MIVVSYEIIDLDWDDILFVFITIFNKFRVIGI